ncbi:hypothetical protein NL676_004286 [Syzygium grande]|nr:hypothetical protein NL676_004286 [Syzygium grande]
MRGVMLVLVLSMMLSTCLAMNKRAHFMVANHEKRIQYLEKNDDGFEDTISEDGFEDPTSEDIPHHVIPRNKYTPPTGSGDSTGNPRGGQNLP